MLFAIARGGILRVGRELEGGWYVYLLFAIAGGGILYQVA